MKKLNFIFVVPITESLEIFDPLNFYRKHLNRNRNEKILRAVGISAMLVSGFSIFGLNIFGLNVSHGIFAAMFAGFFATILAHSLFNVLSPIPLVLSDRGKATAHLDIAANEAVPFLVNKIGDIYSVKFEAVTAVAVEVFKRGYIGEKLNERWADYQETGHQSVDEAARKKIKEQTKNEVDSFAKRAMQDVLAKHGVRAIFYSAEGTADEVDDTFKSGDRTEGSQKEGHYIVDVIEGTDATVTNDKRKHEMTDTDSGGTSILVSGAGVQALGFAPDSYSDQFLANVPKEKRQEVQRFINATLHGQHDPEDPEIIESILQAIAEANEKTIGDLEIVLMDRPREAQRKAALDALKKRFPGMRITGINAGTVAHGLIATLGRLGKDQEGKERIKIVWTAGGTPEAFFNLAVASSIPGAIGWVQIYTSNAGKVHDAAGNPTKENAQNLSARFKFTEKETAQIEEFRPDDAEKIFTGKKIFTVETMKNSFGQRLNTEAAVSFITDNGVFNLPGVHKVETNGTVFYRTHVLQIMHGNPLVIVVDVAAKQD